MNQLNHNIIAVLDIGTTKIACFIAELEANEAIRIIGIGHQISRGIKGGVITDIKQAEASIRAAVGAAEQMAEVTVERVVVNVAGARQHSHRVSVEMPVAGQEITARDIVKLKDQAIEKIHTPDREVIHCIAIEYSIDGAHGIRSPEGMFGNMLRAEIHVVTAWNTTMLNLANCLAKCHLDIEEYMTSAYASGLACLDQDEKELGALVIDIGGGQTALAYFRHGVMTYTDVIPIGGAHITHDLAQGLNTHISAAERAKTLYGSAVGASRDEHEMIDMPQVGEHNEQEATIPRSMLVSVIRPRTEEIFEVIKDHLQRSGINALSGRVVLTGGSAQLSGIKEVAAYVLERQVRIGVPQKFEGMAESTKGPAFSTSVGMMMEAAERRQYSRVHRYSGVGLLRRFWGWWKESA